jgi:cell division protein FtsB
MENELVLNVLFGSISSLLLAVVAYFIKQLHTDFKKMEKDITEVKTMALLIKTEFKNSYDLLSQRVEYLETRIKNLELLNLKNKRDEKG